jgi:murein DD-endopeptidase MepM/ murein hydrolase activator NlpD
LHAPGWADALAAAATRPTGEARVERIKLRLTRSFADQVTPVRLASHLSVLVVAALILFLSQMDVPAWEFSLRAFPNSTLLGLGAGPTPAASQVAALVQQQGGATLAVNESLQRAAVPFTIVQQKAAVQGGIQTYVVQPGDTVLAIAERFGLRPETVLWSNAGLEANADLIRPGDPLNILPVDGVLHTVVAGDTLSSLAAKYKVALEDILNYPDNSLVDVNAQLTVGEPLVIPNGTKPYASQQAVAYSGGNTPATAQIGSGNFVWPTSGSINQRYWGGHPAIDVGAWTGAPVKAADGGYIAVAMGGWNGGYGNHVIIDHGNGFATLYAHLNSIFVRPGENVARGQQVGSVGNTGNSTGPHLHFEIRYQGAPRNPLNYMP